MTDKPKPLTREEWEAIKSDPLYMALSDVLPDSYVQIHEEALEQIAATLDALFRYRERTRGYLTPKFDPDADDIAAEEGIE